MKNGLVLITTIYFLLISSAIVQAKIFVISAEQIKTSPPDKKHLVSDSRTHEIEDDLKTKTGLESIGFDETGELVYDRTEIARNGSRKLRRAITGAIDDQKNIFWIGDYSNQLNIHFAVTDSGTVDLDSKITTYRIKIDFSDFKNCRRYTPKEVLESYTMGIILFHEIDHKVSYDPANPLPATGVRPDKSAEGVPGVIENTNMVRQELSLMMRNSTQHNGELYKGLVDFYRNTLQINFITVSGNRMDLRWKIERG